MTFDVKNFWQDEFEEHAECMKKTQQNLQGAFEALLAASAETIRKGGKILFFGNWIEAFFCYSIPVKRNFPISWNCCHTRLFGRRRESIVTIIYILNRFFIVDEIVEIISIN